MLQETSKIDSYEIRDVAAVCLRRQKFADKFSTSLRHLELIKNFRQNWTGLRCGVAATSNIGWISLSNVDRLFKDFTAIDHIFMPCTNWGFTLV